MAITGDGKARLAETSDHGKPAANAGEDLKCETPVQDARCAGHGPDTLRGSEILRNDESGIPVIEGEGIDTIDFKRARIDLERLFNAGREKPREVVPDFQEKLWGTRHDEEAMVLSLPNGGFMLVWHSPDAGRGGCFACQYVDMVASGRRA